MTKKTCNGAHTLARCECGRELTSCGHVGYTTHTLAPCIHAATAAELFEKLVDDSANNREMDVIWLPFALQRIARQWNMKVDQVFDRMKSEVSERTGMDFDYLEKLRTTV